ncbi:hypothetical protein M1466_00665, partial [Candidatus Dependentiae bacterium]|nr:hypothetical protein [Candidatus Dependentiae bacterium]
FIVTPAATGSIAKQQAKQLCSQQTGWDKNDIHVITASPQAWQEWQRSTNPSPYLCTWTQQEGPFNPLMAEYLFANQEEAQRQCNARAAFGNADGKITAVTAQQMAAALAQEQETKILNLAKEKQGIAAALAKQGLMSRL